MNNKSAPGPIPKKNGIYSIRITTKIPPTIQIALWNQEIKKDFAPFIPASFTLICANILLLLRRKKRANIGIYTRNWPKRSRENKRKNGQMNLKSKEKSLVEIKRRIYINRTIDRTRTMERRNIFQSIWAAFFSPANPRSA